MSLLSYLERIKYKHTMGARAREFSSVSIEIKLLLDSGLQDCICDVEEPSLFPLVTSEIVCRDQFKSITLIAKCFQTQCLAFSIYYLYL